MRAAVSGAPDLAMGNVVGSNIFNIAMVIGVAALISPLAVHGRMIRLEWPVMLVSAVALHVLAQDLRIDRLEGAFLVLALVVFTAHVVRLARREGLPEEQAEFAGAARDEATEGWLRSIGYVVAGGVALSAGAELLVRGAVDLARVAEVPDRIIGVTVVAAGTSLPELFTSAVAAWRGRDDVAVANVLGSNIFNALGILGVTALIHPLQVDPAIVASDDLWMLGLSLLLLPILYSHLRVSRVEGGLLVGSFVVYLALLL